MAPWLLGSLFGFFIGGFTLNFILSKASKDPGLFRTYSLLAVLSMGIPISAVLSRMHPFLPYFVWAGVLYVIQFYARQATGLSAAKTGILVSFIGVVVVISSSGVINLESFSSARHLVGKYLFFLMVFIFGER